uniref:Defective in cullin neddylation protein n=1 Tax=Hirondellea gigas TaxID=1518452 RepID=A0A6A7FU92_9CRUS
MSASSQRRLIKEFRSITAASERTAKDVLKGNEWNLELSMDFYFSHQEQYPEATRPSIRAGSKPALEKIFSKFHDPEDRSVMSADGMAAFFKRIDVDPEGVAGLAISWKLNMQEMGFYQRKEFVNGFSALGVDTFKSIKVEVNKFQQLLSTPAEFKDFYRWAFGYVKGANKSRTVSKDIAIHVFKMIFDSEKYPLTVPFNEFLTTYEENFVNRDVWEQLLDFLSCHKPDLSDYDEESGAWPILFDEFVRDFTEKRAKQSSDD